MARIPRQHLPLIALLSALLTALASYAYLGLFTRYMADDYCLSARLRQHGFLKAQEWWYLNWTGRYASIFLNTTACFLGPRVVPYLSLLALICWLAVAMWGLYQLAAAAGWTSPAWYSLLLAILIIFTTIKTAPNLVQSFYWQTGMLTLTGGLIVFNLNVAIVCWGARRRRASQPTRFLLVGSGLLALIGCGFYETYLFLEIGILLLVAGLMFALHSPWWPTAWPFLVAQMAGSLVSLAITATAPGNAARRTKYPPLPGLKYLIETTLYYVRRYLWDIVYHASLPLALLFGLALVVVFIAYRASGPPNWDQRKVTALIVIVPFAALMLVIEAFGIEVYATTAMPQWRSRIITQFVISCAIVIWGVLWTATLLKYAPLVRRSRASAVIVVMVVMLGVVVAVSVVRRNLQLAVEARANARTWEANDRQLREARLDGRKDVVIAPIDNIESALGGPWDEMPVRRDPTYWGNKCVAEYYELESVRAR